MSKEIPDGFRLPLDDLRETLGIKQQNTGNSCGTVVLRRMRENVKNSRGQIGQVRVLNSQAMVDQPIGFWRSFVLWIEADLIALSPLTSKALISSWDELHQTRLRMLSSQG
ncbi:hypothetical protein AA309_09440 [Microvirga vignae]|uniref:Uncharacterized protein n=1 Tax=Microvirga vignae TaxID=1225564 RepID=A0A0H1RDE1_9HYPH|nr:hypothetical protein AA309_09440 [Microvirga vignae]